MKDGFYDVFSILLGSITSEIMLAWTLFFLTVWMLVGIEATIWRYGSVW